MNDSKFQIFEHLQFIYGDKTAPEVSNRIMEVLERFKGQYTDRSLAADSDKINEQDTILITYGDMVYEEGESPLKTLAEFLEEYVADTISTVHVLPFYPYSSDDGFSVIDYQKVDSQLGTWTEIASLGKSFRLMFDAVVNHISSKSEWFQEFLRDKSPFREYFTVVGKGADLSNVFRPRATPVLTAFDTVAGEKLVWTTFSADQIDLNFGNPDVLVEVIDILLFYIACGAEFIRLDAVTYIWKEIGTSCINLPRTHRIVQLIRTVMDLAAPHVTIITETNVPHKDNIAYFGDGTNEAQMVYNFALPLLTLHAFYKGDASILSDWAATLDLPTDQISFFNFLACHDGIGMLPVKNILSLEDLDEIVSRTQNYGGYVSYKSNEDGSTSPYELNINYLDALDDPSEPRIDVKFTAKRFLSTQAIMLALKGVPGIYFHSLFGSRNWSVGVETTGRFRTINREKLDREKLELELNDPGSLRYHVFNGYKKMLKARKASAAFHPNGGQQILLIDNSIFAVLRTSLDQTLNILCLQNVTATAQDICISQDKLSLPIPVTLVDIISNEKFQSTQGKIEIAIDPYQVIWLQL